MMILFFLDRIAKEWNVVVLFVAVTVVAILLLSSSFLSNDSNNNAVVVAGFVGVLGGIRKMPAMSSAQKKRIIWNALSLYFALISSLLSIRIIPSLFHFHSLISF